MTRVQANAALTDVVPDTAMRAFLLQNLQLGAAPAWRIGLSDIIAGFADIEAWDAPDDARYAGPTLFIAGATSNYIQPAHRPVIRALFPKARFVTLKNAGHWLHADNPAGFVSVVEAFLTGTASPPHHRVMRLTDEESAMLAGEAGRARQWAIEHQIYVGRYLRAADFVRCHRRTSWRIPNHSESPCRVAGTHGRSAGERAACSHSYHH